MSAREKNARKQSLKQNAPSHQVEEFNIVANDMSEEQDSNPSYSTDFNMGSLLDDAIEEAEKELDVVSSKHCNADHFLSSTTISECVWLQFDFLVPQHREGMSPVLLGAILFLKENKDLHSIKDISESLR